MGSINKFQSYINSLKMSDQSSESAIINIAINIFQNVGIRRWIEQIEILKNQQIYFQICKIIFPQTIIHLFRLSQNQSLTTGQKIQGVIDLISKLIKNDLYHISGQAIANGKPTHLKNFLQLLQALSNSMITKDRIEVQSAPENDQSFTYNDYNKSYYTVIGIDKEFGTMICYTEDDQSLNENKNIKESKPTHIRPVQKKPQTQSSQEFPANLDPKNIPESEGKATKKKLVVEQKQKKTPVFTPYPQESKQLLPYPIPLQEKNRRQYQQQNKKWIILASQMNETKINLQRQKIESIKNSYAEWRANHQENVKQSLKNIEKQSAIRKNLINDKINKRQLLLNSLKGEEQAEKAIKNLFKQENRVKAQNKERQKAKQAQNLKKLLNFNQFDQLLEKASQSTKLVAYSRRQ